jgi:hypothetical protein
MSVIWSSCEEMFDSIIPHFKDWQCFLESLRLNNEQMVSYQAYTSMKSTLKTTSQRCKLSIGTSDSKQTYVLTDAQLLFLAV